MPAASWLSSRRIQQTAFDEYVSDPANPVPYFLVPLEVPPEYMVADQRFVADRADVLSYVRPGAGQQDITVAGPVSGSFLSQPAERIPTST